MHAQQQYRGTFPAVGSKSDHRCVHLHILTAKWRLTGLHSVAGSHCLCLTPKIERIVTLLSASPVGERGADAVRYGLQGLIIITLVVLALCTGF
jgi:hypothetical protein